MWAASWARSASERANELRLGIEAELSWAGEKACCGVAGRESAEEARAARVRRVRRVMVGVILWGKGVVGEED